MNLSDVELSFNILVAIQYDVQYDIPNIGHFDLLHVAISKQKYFTVKKKLLRLDVLVSCERCFL